MTYREIYFSLIKENNEYLNRTAVKEILLDVSGYQDFISLLNFFSILLISLWMASGL